MYCNHYGLKEKPFDVTPDPRFLYLSPEHQEALASLLYGIRERRGFIVMVGEVGTGKTTLLNTVLDQLDEKTKVAYIFNTDQDFEAILSHALVDLGLMDPGENLSKQEAVDRLNRFAIEELRIGRNVALIVDEAQNLDHGCLESLRLLSNLETRKHKLIQIVLSGQPELDSNLNDPRLRQLSQRISLRRFINPLNEKETYEYIGHRLAIANYRGPSLFSRRAQQLIWEYSGGIPRKINILCDNALLIGYGLKRKRIKVHLVEETIKDLSWSPFYKKAEPQIVTPAKNKKPHIISGTFRPRSTSATTLVLTACLILVVGLLFVNLLIIPPKGGALPPHELAIGQITRDLNKSYESNKPSLPASAQAEISPEVPLTSVSEEKVEIVVSTRPEKPQETAIQTAATSQPVDSAQPIVQILPVTNNQNGSESNAETANITEEKSKLVDSIIPDASKVNMNTPVMKKQPSWKSLVVKKGDSFSKLVASVYGRSNKTNQKLVHKHNPHIQNVHRIEIGQKIIFPPLSEKEQ